MYTMMTRTETSSDIIAGHGDPIIDFVPGLRCHRAGHCWPMTLFLPGRHWFSASQGWNYNSRNGSADPLALFPHFVTLTNVAKCNLQPIRISQGLIFLGISTHCLVKRADKTCKTLASMQLLFL